MMCRYLGTGELEEKLVSTVNDSLRKEPGLQVKWFLDKVSAFECVHG